MSSDQSTLQPVLLPALGESVSEGTVIRWLKEVGNRVEADEPLLEVSTDKVDTEIPSPVAGTLTEILVRPDEVVEVGTRLASISTRAAPESATGPRPARPPAEHLTQVVRRLAALHDVDLTTVPGTGSGGRIRKQDVLASVPAPAAAAPVVVPVAQRMVEPLRTGAQLTSVVEVDLTDVVKAQQKSGADFARTEGADLSLTAFFAKASVDALKSHPLLNASLDAETQQVLQHDGINLAIAVDTPRGVVAPVVLDAGDLSIVGLARRIDDLAARTLSGTIASDELAGGTFTLTNTGSRGALFDTPVIDQPQAAVLGVGAVVRRPVVLHDDRLGETIAIRSMAYLSLTYDQRLIDGAGAARFLTDVRRRLEQARFGL